MNSLLTRLIESTRKGKLEWQGTSSPCEVRTVLDNIIYTVECDNPEKEEFASLYQWDDAGNYKEIDDIEDRYVVYNLFRMVLDAHPDLNSKYLQYCRPKEKKEEPLFSVSLYKVMKRLGYESSEGYRRISIKETDYFYYAGAGKNLDKYIQPLMKAVPTSLGYIPYDEANVILVSAPGATGKSAMSAYLSSRLDIPVFDLGKYEAVGANTIVGLLMKEVEMEDIFAYNNGLKDGSRSMIIDGLDEGAIKITEDGFEAFLSDVAFFAKDSKGLSFVILGRPAVMEDAALFLEEKGVKTTLLQIEPFTIEKAKDFINAQIDARAINKFNDQYKKVRDYIIEEVGGFFRNESEMTRTPFERFIGYAPVLMSIKTLLNDHLNFDKLLGDLQIHKKQKIELLVDIVERILRREQKKIHEEILSIMLDSNYTVGQKAEIGKRCGTIGEQCFRMLSILMGKTSEYNVFDNAKTDEIYNGKMNKWMESHPFILRSSGVFENIVFESFVIVQLIRDKEYSHLAFEWLSATKSDSYLLIDLYDCMSGEDRRLDYRMVPYLISSFKALDTVENIGTVEIYARDDKRQASCECEFSLGRGEDVAEYEFSFSLPKAEALTIPSPLSSINIDAPVNVEISAPKADFCAPVFISCDSLKISSKDMLLSNYKSGSPVVLECRTFEALCSDGSYPNLINRSNSKEALRIFTNVNLVHPFCNFRENLAAEVSGNDEILQRFTKLRRMILMFRTHSKGGLARCCSKIDNRIGKSPMGKVIIDRLLSEKVMYMEGTMYFINYEKFAKVIGAKYDDIRSCKINRKTQDFLNTIR